MKTLGREIKALRDEGWTIIQGRSTVHNIPCQFCGYEPDNCGFYYYNRFVKDSKGRYIDGNYLVPICNMCDLALGHPVSEASISQE